jgi:hypothetical protein
MKTNDTSRKETENKESQFMSAKSSLTPHVESVVLPVASAAAPTTSGSPPPTAAPTVHPPLATTSPPATSLVTVVLPPAGVMIPTPPSDYSPATPGEFRTVTPRKAELTCLPQALIDLSSFISFDQTMGSGAPTLAEVLQAITAGAAWSATRQATANWDGYASLMEGLAWRLIRAQLASLRPAFALAMKRNPRLAEQYAGLAKLLSVPATVAQAGADTKRANKKAEAEGKPATHGKVGKSRQRKAAKAALAAGGTATAAQPATNGASAPVEAPVAPVN